MTVADVAKVAGVSTTLVHYHFSSKVDLITATVRVACDDDKQLRDSTAEGPGSVVNRLDRVLCGSLPSDTSDGSWLLWIETWGETRRLPPLREAMAELTEHEIEVVHRLFAEGAAAGEFVCADPAPAAARLSALATASPSSRPCSMAGSRPMCSSTSFAAAFATSSGCHRAEYDRLLAISE